MMQLVHFRDLGTMDYATAWQLQEGVFRDIIDKKLQNRLLPIEKQLSYQHQLLFVEHPPVITLGKNADDNNVLFNEEALAQRGVQLFHINRGGDVTYHGPGQLVGYPILDLDMFTTDLGVYLRNIEEVIIRTIADYGLVGERSPGETGVWLDVGKPTARKICAIGIRTSRWVTMHGFAFNVNANLDHFNFIIPCGIPDKAVTSLQNELNSMMSMDEVKQKVRHYFEIVFDCKLV
ncbi:MAG TPA: lipoyl(octanoyl) transferase LipB [Chitinophagales bacterium]|nr:lipoyl(octanoyl) transferase LipB [Chitinophagales bacterium]HMX05373.1 lipoyl(octanoyl) transferase LipB [Chitinophagales bacterium]HNA59252.1 lipoyl(octanoyl) transferase LipB [Chitinophagales bacterium]HNF70194.1 lipoyl(octanoyl) transferase LipB [Chitinophagales bacterium]HNI54823.1 lipoyl(octanoyl) transferase LipB [Chitinophagales bacterium]